MLNENTGKGSSHRKKKVSSGRIVKIIIQYKIQKQYKCCNLKAVRTECVKMLWNQKDKKQ